MKGYASAECISETELCVNTPMDVPNNNNKSLCLQGWYSHCVHSFHVLLSCVFPGPSITSIAYNLQECKAKGGVQRILEILLGRKRKPAIQQATSSCDCWHGGRVGRRHASKVHLIITDTHCNTGFIALGGELNILNVKHVFASL